MRARAPWLACLRRRRCSLASYAQAWARGIDQARNGTRHRRSLPFQARRLCYAAKSVRSRPARSAASGRKISSQRDRIGPGLQQSLVSLCRYCAVTRLGSGREVAAARLVLRAPGERSGPNSQAAVLAATACCGYAPRPRHPPGEHYGADRRFPGARRDRGRRYLAYRANPSRRHDSPVLIESERRCSVPILSIEGKSPPTSLPPPASVTSTVNWPADRNPARFAPLRVSSVRGYVA